MVGMEVEAYDDVANWASMEAELKEAACEGNDSFLREAICMSKARDYWLSRFIPSNNEVPYAGNILHLAVWHGHIFFVTFALKQLPEEIVHLLLCQQETAGELLNWNPLHLAVSLKDNFLVEVIVNRDSNKAEWTKGFTGLKGCPEQVYRAKDSKGRTPALLATEVDRLCAEILTEGSKTGLVQDIVDDQGNSPLFLAVQKGLDKVVMNLLDCKDPLCASGPNGSTALHAAQGLLLLLKPQRNEVYEKLFGKLRDLITATDNNGFTVLHKWIEIDFQCWDSLYFSQKEDVNEIYKYLFQYYPNDAVRLMSMIDGKDGNNPLHHAAIMPFEDAAILMAEELTELYKNSAGYSPVQTTKVRSREEETAPEASNLPQNHDRPWLMKNNNGDTPLLLATRNKLEKLALRFLKKDPVDSLRLGDQENPFILAVYNGCFKLAKKILAIIAQHHDLRSLLPFNEASETRILDLALRYPATFLEQLKEKLPSFINRHDGKDDTVSEASKAGAASLLRHIKLGSYADYQAFNCQSWPRMDPKLKEAACSGNANFFQELLKASVTPYTYWLSRFIPSTDNDDNANDEPVLAGNILHLIVLYRRADFLRATICNLPTEVVHQLLCHQETTGLPKWNPLHLSVHINNIYCTRAISMYVSCPEQVYVAKDSNGMTPALLALFNGYSHPAYSLTLDYRAELIKNTVDDQGNSPLFLAVKNNDVQVVRNLLEREDPLCCSGADGLTALHIAPRLSIPDVNVDVVYHRLLGRFPDLITKADKNGITVLHKWVEMGCNLDNHVTYDGLKSLFEYFFDKHGADAIKLILATDFKDGNNPLHVLAATSASITTFSEPMAVKIAPQLMSLSEKFVASNLSQNHDRPWLMKNKHGDTPLLLAMRYKLEDLALCFLRQDPEKSLKASADKENPLLFAIDNINGSQRLVREILGVIAANKSLTSLLTFSTYEGSNILHSASTRDYPETVIKEVVEKFPSLITERDRVLDQEGETPLDKASEAGKLWLVELMVKKDPESLSKARHAWQKACENGHLDVIKSFIKHCHTFRGICLGHRDTPLHHIKLKKGSYAQYREFLEYKVIEEMINTRDVHNRTPLHKAITSKDIDLTEALFTIDDINLHVKDEDGDTPMDLLAEQCKDNKDWLKMCGRVQIDPTLKTTYVQRRKDLLKIRDTLLVVAALLAAITFQAGFTLPGGLNSDSGQAVLAKKASFLAFLLADVYAMCSSILALFCLIWSMFCDSNRSMLLIDSSMSVLLHSLYASLVAFMTGVYTVISDKSLWLGITTVVMCSLIGISAASGKFLHWLLAKRKKGYSRLRKELGKTFTSAKKSSESNSEGEGEASTSMNKSSEINSAPNHVVQIT